MPTISKRELLDYLRIKKDRMEKVLKEIDDEIGKLSKELADSEFDRDLINEKCCIKCTNRDKKCDFFIPEAIVCTHPSNSDGKDKFKYYMHTCEYWEPESTKIEDFIVPGGEEVVVSEEELLRMEEELAREYERIDRDAAVAEIESRNIILNQ